MRIMQNIVNTHRISESTFEFLDIEKALDMLWHDGLIQEFYKAGVN